MLVEGNLGIRKLARLCYKTSCLKGIAFIFSSFWLFFSYALTQNQVGQYVDGLSMPAPFLENTDKYFCF